MSDAHPTTTCVERKWYILTTEQPSLIKDLINKVWAN